ncbi:hypothetical protein K450DRAFT_253934 [Umbelopsis ramanniana AG]|uniref:histidine kinase n=1 Tax=Umbelopsis ramanniana AG TaxID=1314678 RepID=A0AAD5HAJ6_UMBRA|nr:uncharacterized protein K450DRAFT_253934 [Umbelopsis ramanniana AG]KAI8577007.1 hypothetical protein K450DRAFT_253934 [Umbelopsis ramanniana AG]
MQPAASTEHERAGALDLSRRSVTVSSDPLVYARSTSQYHAQLYNDQQQRVSSNDHPSVKLPNLPQFNQVVLSLEPPNLYKTALKLSSEIDLQNWWYATIDILSQSSFHASRVCLSLPQDPSDPYHSPWGVKAVYSKSNSTQYQTSDAENDPSTEHQPSDDYFSKSSLGMPDFTSDGSSDKPKVPTLPLCFESLQPFDRDDEPLVDKNSVDRIIRRGHTVVLSREYRQSPSSMHSSNPSELLHEQDGSGMFKRSLMERLDSYHHHHQVHHQQHAPPGTQFSQQPPPPPDRKDLLRRRSSNAISMAQTPPPRGTPCLNLCDHPRNEKDECRFEEAEALPHSSSSGDITTNNSAPPGEVRELYYDEYEQHQPSPWSQSPAPSPIMMDPNVNPFFQSNIGIDDDAFNPTSPESYSTTSIPYPVPIGNIHSIVHIPIYHHTGRNTGKLPTGAPFAILSFLSTVVPYPQILISCIESIVPFIATSLSTCLAHQHLQRQLFYYRHQDSGNHNPFSTSDTQSPSKHEEISPETASSNPISPAQSRQHPYNATTDTDSATPTPTAKGVFEDPGRGPFSAGGIAMLQQMETSVPEDDMAQEEAPDFNLNYDKHTQAIVQLTESSSSSSFPQGQDTATHPTSNRFTSSTAVSTPDSSGSASPLSSAMRHGWDAISPTTGLPIVSSIPPSSVYRWRTLSSGSSAYDSEAILSPGTSEEIAKRQGGRRIILPARTNIVHPTMDDDALASDEADEPPEKPKPKVKRRHPPPSTQPTLSGSEDTEGGERKKVHQFFEANGDTDVVPSDLPMDETRMITPKSRLLRLIIDGIPIHVFTCSTRTGRTTWVNSRVMQYSGQPMKHHLGSHWLSHMHADDRHACRQQWKDAFERGVGFAGQYRLKRFDGEYRYFLWRTVPLRDVKGNIINWFGTCTDIHDERVAKELSIRQLEIEHNERKYRLLAETIPQLVFTFSPEFGITYANQKWEDYSGKPLDCAKGLAFMAQVHSEDRHKLRLPEVGEDESVSWQEEIRLLGKDGEYRWFLIKCNSVHQDEIPDARWFGTCTDINDQKQFEQKLKEAHDAAQKSTESKTRFLSNMSHEIRTPLIGITGMVNFMLDSDLTPEQLDYAHTIQQSAESLLVVINDILDLSKVEAGMMKLEMEPFSLLGMVEDANELLSTLAIQKGLEMSFWVDPDVPDVVIGDRIRLRQVLLNLIGNAIKFTTSGEVYTKCTVQKPITSDSEIMLMFEVVDTGSGFDADGEAVMFKPFSQVDASSTRKHGGSGLGLVISRQLIELHGGSVTCTSRKGEGSTFYFTVKFSIPHPATLPRPQTPQEETIKSPFFRASAYGVHSHGMTTPLQQQVISSALETSGFGTSSPLEHSIKHTQLGVVTSAARVQEALLYKTAPSGGLLPTGAGQANPDVTTDFAGAVKKRDLSCKISRELQLPKAFRTSTDDIEAPSQPTLSVPSHIQSTPSAPIAARALIVSEWIYSRDVAIKHIETLLKEHYKTIDTLDVCHSHVEALQILTNPDKLPYSWIVINLSMQQQILPLIRHIATSPAHKDAITIVLTTHMQRSTIFEGASDEQDRNLFDNCEFVFKPLKRSKIQQLFPSSDVSSSTSGEDPAGSNATVGRKRSLRNRHLPPAQQMVAGQHEVFQRMLAEVGNRGHRVLLVEDNLVNQKVMVRYLVRVGLEVDVVSDGSQCVDAVLSRPHNYYALILCDLFMPVKDGYEATKEIREWEAKTLHTNAYPIPIVALSANVMSDVAEKCKQVGFSNYISKPVNFTTLSNVVRGYIQDHEKHQTTTV